MVFEVKSEKDSYYPEKPFVEIFKNVLSPEKATIQKVSFDGNDIKAVLMQTHYTYPPGIDVMLPDAKKEEVILVTGYERIGDNKHEFRFQMPEGYKFQFEFCYGFHETSRAMLGKTGNLEKLFGEIPETAKTTLGYQKMPLGLWEGLPRDIFLYMTQFGFSNGKVSVSWPYFAVDSLRGKEVNPAKIQVSKSVIKEENESRDKLIQTLVGQGLIRQETVQSKSRGFPQSIENLYLTIQNIPSNEIRKFEEALRAIGKSGTADLGFQGEMPFNLFLSIPTIYDQVLREGEIKTSSFTLQTSNSSRPLTNILVEGDFETAAKIGDTLPCGAKDLKFIASGNGRSEILYKRKD